MQYRRQEAEVYTSLRFSRKMLNEFSGQKLCRLSSTDLLFIGLENVDS